ncbi:MAG TPA: DMT family transporter, partial [Methylomirabilota bacterium]|nr:DMT family transporter [Methylomirabilota bacterium]
VLDAVAPQAALWFAAVGVTGPCLGRLFNYRGVQRLGAARATPLINSSPLFTTILALFFLHEHITLRILLGVLCIVSGIAVLTGQQRGKVEVVAPHAEFLDGPQDKLRRVSGEVEG